MSIEILSIIRATRIIGILLGTMIPIGLLLSWLMARWHWTAILLITIAIMVLWGVIYKDSRQKYLELNWKKPDDFTINKPNKY